MSDLNNANLDEIAALKARLAELEKQNQELEAQVSSSNPKIEISDEKLAKRVSSAFEKLESYFPEHKVFAFDSIDSGLRERFSALFKEIGYDSLNDMLLAYGFEIISGNDVRKIRNEVLYLPGNEPEVIKSKVDAVIEQLCKYYPNHQIERSIQNDHKKLSMKVSGLYQWLGYENTSDFLSAYGFEYLVGVAGDGGRPEIQVDVIINTLKKKYKNLPKPKTMGDLMYENPEYKANLKTLQNRAKELFGMTLKDYFTQIGFFEEKSETSLTVKTRVKGETIQIVAKEKLEQIYCNIDNSIYGTFEEALEKLNGLEVKYRKSKDEICIYKALECHDFVEIPYGIDYIEESAFENQTELKEIKLQNSIKRISANAFAGCSSLLTVYFSEGISNIEKSAFKNCTSLNNINLPLSLSVVGSEAFSGCSSLEYVELLNEHIIVESKAFDGCIFEYKMPTDDSVDLSLYDYTIVKRNNVKINKYLGAEENVNIPAYIENNLVTTIAPSAFEGNVSIVTVNMPDTICKLGGAAFRGCISLKKIHLSNSIEKIVSTTFIDCKSLTDINIPDSVTSLANGTFRSSPLRKLNVGSGLKEMNSKALYLGEYNEMGIRLSYRNICDVQISANNEYLMVENALVLSRDGKVLHCALVDQSTYDIPNTVEVIEPYAFFQFDKIQDVRLPSNLRLIKNDAFCRTSLRKIKFPENLIEIQDSAFYGCAKMTSAIFNDVIRIIGKEAFEGSPIRNVKLPASITELGEDCFDAICRYANYDQVFSIENGGVYFTENDVLYKKENDDIIAVRYCSKKYKELEYDWNNNNIVNLKSLVIADGTTIIGERAFYCCRAIEEVILPQTVIEIKEQAFNECTYLTEVVLPKSIRAIKELAFYSTSIEEINLPCNLETIGAGALASTGNYDNRALVLNNIKLEENEKFFIHNHGLYTRFDNELVIYFGTEENVELCEGTTKICSYAFVESSAREVQIPNTVKTIEEKAFHYCNYLQRIVISIDDERAVIYFPQIDTTMEYDYYSYETQKVREEYLDCIRTDREEIFDFVKYDSLFESITKVKDRVLIATDRLKSDYKLAPVYRESYLSYLQKNADKAVKIVIEYDDLDGLNTLAELNVFNGENIDSVIELANRVGKTDVLSFLMDYKNDALSIDPFADFNLD